MVIIKKMAGYKVSDIRWDGKKTDQAPVNNQLQKFSQVSTTAAHDPRDLRIKLDCHLQGSAK